MIAQVIPLRRLPPHLSFFDYEVPEIWKEKIQVGNLVRVPFRAGTLVGIVTKLSDTTATQNVRAISSYFPYVVTQQQLALILFLSDHYHISPALIAKLCAPEPPQKNIETTKQDTHYPNISFSKIVADKQQGWFMYDSYAALWAYLQHQIARDGQTLILYPERYLEYTLQSLVGTISHDHLLVPDKLGKKDFFNAWLSSQRASIILGTFHSLFLPFYNLKKVILIDADNPLFYKAEQSPRLHIYDFIEKYVDLYACEILCMGTSIPVEMQKTLSKNESYSFKKSISSKEILTVDMKDEHEKKNFLLSDTACEVISKATTPVLLYLNQLDTQDKHDQLTNPEAQESITDARSSFGTRRLYEVVVKRFPDKKTSLYSSNQKIFDLKADIIIATSAFISTDIELGSIIMIDADTDFFRADFQASQSLRRQILQLRLRSKKLIIQTKNPDHYVFRTLNSPQDFYAKEMAVRKEFGYPPTQPSYKLIVNGDTQAVIKSTVEAIKKLIPESQIAGETQKIDRKKPHSQIIVRGQLPKTTIDQIYRNHYNTVLIEINPFNW